MEEMPSRRDVLKGLAASVATGALATQAEAAEKKEHLDIDKQLEELEVQSEALVAAIKRARELQSNPQLATLGEGLHSLNELAEEGEAIEKLTRPFKRK